MNLQEIKGVRWTGKKPCELRKLIAQYRREQRCTGHNTQEADGDSCDMPMDLRLLVFCLTEVRKGDMNWLVIFKCNDSHTIRYVRVRGAESEKHAKYLAEAELRRINVNGTVILTDKYRDEDDYHSKLDKWRDVIRTYTGFGL